MKKNKIKKRKGFYLNFAIVSVTFLITMIAVFTGSYIQEGYDIKTGSISPKRFIAPREVENTIATEKKRLEAVNSVLPVYKLNTEVKDSVISVINTFFGELNDLYIADLESQNKKTQLPEIPANIPEITDPANAETSNQADLSANDLDLQEEVENVALSFSDLKKQYLTATSMFLTQTQYELYKSLGDESRKDFSDKITDILNAVMEQGVKDEDTKSFLIVRDELSKLSWNEDLKDFGYAIITWFIEPNLFVDEDATNEAKDKKAAEVEPVMLQTGEKIVDENERITEEAYQILDSIGLIKENKRENYIPFIGAAIIVMIIQLFAYIYIVSFYKKMLTSRKESLLLFTIYLTAIVVIRLTAQVQYSIVPLIIFPMLIAILLDNRLAIVINFVITLTGALICKGDVMYIIFFFVTGTMSTLVIKHVYERNKVISVGIIISIINALMSAALGLFFEKNYSFQILNNCMYATLSGIFAVIATIGSLPIWEVMFDVITPLKLLELTNPNSPLLRHLMIEAPGTYHHSLIVANLAETAAYDLDANATLARVGGYYHDVGKLRQPGYFTENQLGDNPHDMMEPSISSRIILQHVPIGIDFAKEYKLPKAVKDIISQHHGTTVTMFFYRKAINLYPDKTVDPNEFKYQGPIPQSKEAACVMLADTVEAAIRSKPAEEKNMQSIEKTLKTLIKAKLDDGQLDESLLTIKDLETIRKAFMRVFHGIYHERISYPNEEVAKEGVVKDGC